MKTRLTDLGPNDSVRMVLARSAVGLAVLAFVCVLYFGREVLIPVALAILLSFVLSPPIRGLQKLRLPRGLAVGLVVILTCGTLAVFGLLIAAQVTNLASKLPDYQSTLREKIQLVRGSSTGSQTLQRASSVLGELRRELEKPDRTSSAPVGTQTTPVLVEVKDANDGPFHSLMNIITPLLHPLTNTALVLLFVVFILMQQGDLRNRLIVLAGTRDIQRTTLALDDAADRLGRLLQSQLGLNFAFGLIVAIGLTVIGVPSAPLWGVVAMIMRFVPYIGALLAAVFPLVLAAAVGQGWNMFLETAALFLIAEPVFGHLLEPLVFGKNTGLSPIAIVFSATFWTWIWGPVGLVLATPLMVCLVVLGRHVEALKFLEVMFGDKSPLTPAETAYQSLLSKDPAELSDQADKYLKQHTVGEYYNDIMLESLALARRDEIHGQLTLETSTTLLAGVTDIVLDFSGRDLQDLRSIPATNPKAQLGGFEKLVQLEKSLDDAGDPALTTQGSAILCIGGFDHLDDASAVIVEDLLKRAGFKANLETHDAFSISRFLELSILPRTIVCVCTIGTVSNPRLRYIVRRLRKKVADIPIVFCMFRRGENSNDNNAESNDINWAFSLDEVAPAVERCRLGQIEKERIIGAS